MSLRPPTLDTTVLEDRYEITQLLGEGAMGIVFLAHDKILGIPVAVKMLRAAHLRHRELVERFDREARLAQRMLSPHVVKVLAHVLSRSGAPCIVYEHLQGEVLGEALARAPKRPLAEVGDVVIQTARALSRVHSLGVLHRDVKPDNLFVIPQSNGRPIVKLIDFGVAEPLDAAGTGSEGICGTPEYLAPEVIAGGRPDARSDVYALGVVAFECLTGVCPFTAERLDELFALVAQGKRTSVRDGRPELPPEIDEWMDRALHPDPFWRFASARELSEGMQLALRAADRRSRTVARAA